MRDSEDADRETEIKLAEMVARRRDLVERLEAIKMDPRSDDSGRFAEFANADEVTKRKLLEAQLEQINQQFRDLGINPETL